MNLPFSLPSFAKLSSKSTDATIVFRIYKSFFDWLSALRFSVPYRLHWYIADFSLGMMIIGPLIMPFFLQANSSTLNSVGALIQGIGQFICPQLSYSPIYGGMSFAVCYRCSAALFGLIIARGLHRPSGAMHDLGWKTRMLWLLLCVAWLTVEVQGTGFGWWPGIVPLMLIHGVIYGISVGGVVYAALLALDRIRQPVQRPGIML